MAQTQCGLLFLDNEAVTFKFKWKLSLMYENLPEFMLS